MFEMDFIKIVNLLNLSNIFIIACFSVYFIDYCVTFVPNVSQHFQQK